MSAATRNPEGQTKADLMRILSANLLRELAKREWDQADLARASGLVKDSIHSYCTQKTLPRPLALSKMANALRIKPSELMPSALDSIGFTPAGDPSANRPPVMEFVAGDATFARIRFDDVVFSTTAIEIMRLLAADQAELSNDNDLSEQG